MRLTSTDALACWLDMMEAVGDVGIQDRVNRMMSFLGRIVVDRIDLCIDDHRMSSYARQRH